MSFRTPSGPPASVKQLEYLASLLEQQDFGTFREARHRLGLTQRQAAGKFTVGEASELIERLEAGEVESDVVESLAVDRADVRLQREREEAVVGFPADLLADELSRRGWCCIPPTE